jgi:glycolate oxidase FAD binding subunit
MSARDLAEQLGPKRARLSGVEAELPMAAPESLDALIEIVHRAREGHLKILPIGAGTRLGGVHACGADLLLSTRRLTGVVAYEPGDGTITAHAGTTMSDLCTAVAAGGHRLTPDVPRPARATLGGVLADGWSGCDRLRFGPTRHHVLGMRVLLSEGGATKTGGRLVKNVTGFELHRLYAGSGGSLCLILEASMRLFPAPAARAHATCTCDSLDAALALAKALSTAPLTPTAITLAPNQDRWTLTATIDGRAERVTRERSLITERAPFAVWCEGAEALAAHDAARDSSPPEGETPSLRISIRPSRILSIIEALRSHAPECHLLAHPATGTIEARLDAGTELDSLVSDLRQLSATVRVRGAHDSSAHPRASAALEARLSEALDPHDLFCGRP